ncbi:MAG: ABC transporter permease, partial [Thermoguttaceae bacterium]|nr:ABC transporter permease [Thermoguttaceae bacterium]
MNATIFWRLAWKEHRVQRTFWIAMQGLVLLAQVLVVAWPGPKTPERACALFVVGMGLAAFYGLGAGATLFATEHETGTYDFQRSLPVSARQLFAAKTALALASTVALLALVWLSAFVLAVWFLELPEPAVHGQVWGLWGVAAVELLVWGVFFSLRS